MVISRSVVLVWCCAVVWCGFVWFCCATLMTCSLVAQGKFVAVNCYDNVLRVYKRTIGLGRGAIGLGRGASPTKTLIILPEQMCTTVRPI